VDDDALDDELQDGLLVGERGVVEPAAHARAERRQVRQDLAGLGPLLAWAALLVQLPAQGAALVGQLPPPLGQLLQADHLRLVGVEQPVVGARQALEARAKPLLGRQLAGRGPVGIAGELLELGEQPFGVAEEAADMVPHGARSRSSAGTGARGHGVDRAVATQSLPAQR
jgi:hypothetical protein